MVRSLDAEHALGAVPAAEPHAGFDGDQRPGPGLQRQRAALAFAAEHGGEDRLGLAALVGRVQVEHPQRRELGGAVAELGRDGRIGVDEPAVGSGHHDDVVDGVEEGAEVGHALAQRLLGAQARADVAEGHPRGERLAVGAAPRPALKVRPEVAGGRFAARPGSAARPGCGFRFAAEAQQTQLAGLRLGGLLEHPQEPVVHIAIGREDEGGERQPDEPLPLHAQQGGGGQVGIAHDARVVQSEIAHRRQVEEVEVLLALRVQLVLGAAQLLVLHLELDLVDAQLVDGGGELHGHGRGGGGGGGGGKPVEALLGLPAQLVGLVRRRRVLGRCRRLAVSGRHPVLRSPPMRA